MVPKMSENTTSLTAEDRQDIIQLTCRLIQYGDNHQWDKVATCFTNPLLLDYTELLGGEPKLITPQEQAEAWHHELGGLDKSFHLLTNHVVEGGGDEARCSAYLHATHILANPQGDSTYVVAGTYTFDLKRGPTSWLISKQKLSVSYITGNPAILAMGEARVKAGH
jgi:hypothetical protein